METTFPLEARIWARVNSRWAKRAAWLGAIFAAGVLLRLTLLRPDR